MLYMGGLALECAAAIYVAGAQVAGLRARRGRIPVPTVEAGLAEAASAMSAATRRCSSCPTLSTPAFHLTAKHRA